jgi:tetratricopeptide (TPR) repeat protein
VWLRLAWLEADPAAAEGHADRYVQLRPDDPFGLVSRAALHHAAGRWSAMGEDLEHAAGLGPIGARGHRLLAAYLRHRGHDEEARFHAAMSARNLPGGVLDDPLAGRPDRLVTYADPAFTRFFALVDGGRCGEALPGVEDLLARYADDRPNHGRISAAAALCLYRARSYAEAERYALAAREVFPRDPPIVGLLGLIQLNQGRLADALARAEELLAESPDSPDGLHLRALAEISLATRREGDPTARLERAVADLERCVRMDPLHLEYLKALASAHGLLENWRAAEAVLARALKVRPEDPGLRALEARVRARGSFWPQS